MESKKPLSQAELLSTQLNAENSHKQNWTLIDRKPIEGSPFWQIQTEQGFFAVMGENVMSPVFKTEQELDEHFKKNHWDITCLLILTLIHHVDQKSIDYINKTKEEQNAKKSL